MPIINVPQGGQARQIHVQQIINWLRGLPQYSEAINHTGYTSDVAHAMTVANRGLGGLALAVKNALRTVTLFEVKEAGAIVRPNAASGTVFRVRNFADNADLFSVAADGSVSIGSTGAVVTIDGVQTVTNKTLTAPNLNTPVIPSYADFLNTATPTTPAAGSLRVFENADSLRYINSASVVRQLATLDGTETLTNKTLTTPSMNGPVISNYADYTQGGAPLAPSAGINRLYGVAGPLLRYIHSGGTKELVDTDSVQTLVNKTLNFSSGFVGLTFGASPGGTASANRIWTDGANIFYTTPGGSIVTLLSSTNTPTVAALSFARSIMTGAIG